MLKLTYEFATHEELLEHLKDLGYKETGAHKAAPKATAKETAAAPLAKTAVAAAAAATSEGAAASQNHEAAASNGVVAAAASSSSEITLDMVREEFRAYVQRPGLTAQTAHANILVPHGLSALKDAKPEQFSSLYNAFKSAA